MKILIVDDSKTSRIVIESFLRSFGYDDIFSVQSAEEAMKYLEVSSSNVDEPGIDLILMDIVMPGMDGIEATRLIKANAKFCDIPIVMVSVRDVDKSLEQAFEAGALDYINKPINKIDLRARVRSILKLKQEMDSRKIKEKEIKREILMRIKAEQMLEERNIELENSNI